MRLRRICAYALVPLSALPLVAVAPLVAPSFEHRLQQLTGGSHAVVHTTTERTR
jgi:hypothetical protein